MPARERAKRGATFTAGARLRHVFSARKDSAQRGEFFRRVPLHEMLAAVDEVQVEPGVELHRERGAFCGMAASLFRKSAEAATALAEPLPERLRFSLRFLLVAAARASALEERPEILPVLIAVARPQHGRRDQGLVEEALLEEPARIFQSGFGAAPSSPSAASGFPRPGRGGSRLPVPSTTTPGTRSPCSRARLTAMRPDCE